MPWNLFEWTWTRSKSRTQQTAADDPMLTYFLTELDVRTRDIERTIGNDAEKRAVLSEIKDALTKFEATFNEPLGEPNYKAWNEAYRLERLIAVIEPGDNLLPELRRRVAQALQEKVTSATRLSAALEAALPQTFDTNETPPKLRPHGEAILRAMLLETLEDIHWSYQRKFFSRPILRSATRKIVFLGFVAFLLFICPYVVLYGMLAMRPPPAFHEWASPLVGGNGRAFWSFVQSASVSTDELGFIERRWLKRCKRPHVNPVALLRWYDRGSDRVIFSSGEYRERRAFSSLRSDWASRNIFSGA